MGNEPSVIKEGVLKCSLPVQEAYMEDIFSCIFFQLPYRLEIIHFPYASATLSLIIIFISLFGRIKLHYRWFILNQGIIDILTCHDFICSEFGDNRGRLYQYCYYTGWLRDCIEFHYIIFKLPCFALFLLTGSRFVAIYFSRTYKKFAKNWIIIFGIILINTVYILFNFSQTFLHQEYSNAWEKFFCYYETNETYNNIFDITNNCAPVHFRGYLLNWHDRIDRIIPVFALFFSVIFVIFLIKKIKKQMKFQIEANKEMLKANIRIAIVFSIQTFILSFIFLLDFCIEMNRDGLIFNLNSPKWMKWLFYKDTVRAFRLIRVFIDSVTILIFMGGYREDLIFGILWILNIPKRILKHLKNLKHIIKKKNSVTSFFTI